MATTTSENLNYDDLMNGISSMAKNGAEKSDEDDMSEQTKQMFNHRSGLSAKVFASSVSQPLGKIRYHQVLLMLDLLLMTMLHKSPTASFFSPKQPAEANSDPKTGE